MMKLMIRAHDLGVMGEENILAGLSELGLDGIQLVAYKSIEGVSYSLGALDPLRAESIGKTISRAGMEVALLGAYFNPVHPNREKAERGIAIFEEYLSLAKALGASAVGSETGSLMGDPWGFHPDNCKEKTREIVVSTFRHLADTAARYGVSVGIEGAYNHVCSTPDILAEVISKINRENVRVIFDLYNYLSISNYKSAYEILARGHALFGGDILLYHIKDFLVSEGKLTQCGVGKGVLDFGRILRAIHKQNPDAVLVLEGTVGEDIPFAVQHIKGIIGQIENEIK